MLKNYFKIAWRNLMKSKVFSFINIFGLSVGLACCMLIVLYLYNELSYDTQHVNKKQLYQVITEFKMPGQDIRMPATPAPMAAALKQEFPEVEETARLFMFSLFGEEKTLLQYASPNGTRNSFYEPRGFVTDPTFFKLFTYNFVEGDPATALVNSNTVVLSEEIAHRLFGNQPALNKVIRISSNNNGDQNCTVTGVFKPSHTPSHIDGNFFISVGGGSVEQYMKRDANNMAVNNMYITYLLLKPGTDAVALEKKLPAFIDKYGGKDLKAAGFTKKEFILPVTDIHLYSRTEVNVTPVGSVTYLYILGSIALLTLLIACINFMNLSTARSSKRSAEVGVRKVLGAERSALVRQFLGESLLMAIIAYVFAIIIMELLVPAFESVSGKHLALYGSSNVWLLIAFFALSVLTGLLAGSYPAFYLSSFKPVKVLKGRFSNSLAAASLRKGLVIFQFVISVMLIVASVVINGQMRFLRSTDLGFAKDRQLVLPMQSSHAKEMYLAFKGELLKNKQVLSVGGCFYYPGIFNPSDQNLYKEGQSIQEATHVRTNVVDESFMQTLGLKPVAGRLFSTAFLSDTNGKVIINENAVKKLGFASPQAAIGKKLFNTWKGTVYDHEIIGVVKDFHFEDLRQPITPFSFYLNNEPYYNYIVVHASGSEMAPLISTIQSLWRKMDPDEPFIYTFLDQDFQRNYLAENRLSAMVGYFTAIAILISCLGLFGLATFSAEQRMKEIGVRKVLGASLANIVSLLSKDFLKLVLVAVVVASPIAWYVMNRWLQQFAYRIGINWVVFAITAVTAIGIALFAIGFQSVKAAMISPVKSLKSE